MASKYRGRVFWPNCKVCQYIKRHPDLRKQLEASTYYDPNGTETLTAVWKRWGDPFIPQTIYSHMRRHDTTPKKVVEALVPIEVVPSTDVVKIKTDATHEQVLDEIIAKGRVMVQTGEIKVTGQLLNQALKTKADIEKSNKDRGVDIMGLMAGAFANHDD